jgi:RND superfamily putative drug exporter
MKMNGKGMARWGRHAAWLGLALWAVTAALLLPLAGKTADLQSTDPALALPRTAEATRALVRERAAFPGADTPVAVVVYVRDSGITAQDRSAVEADRSAFAGLSRDKTVDPAAPSADGKALVLSVPIAGDNTQAAAVVKQIKARSADAPAGLQAAVTGSAGVLADADEAFGGVETTLLLAAAGVVALLLLITYRSPFLWIVPLASVGLASQLATGVVYLLGRYAGVTVTESSTALMLILVFGAGTDYALLLIARYREELRRHANRYAAMAVAWRRSIPAVLASAATVTVGLLGLLAGQMNDVRGLGPVAAAGIVVAFAVVTTLMPALLAVLGRWVFWPFIPRCSLAVSTASTVSIASTVSTSSTVSTVSAGGAAGADLAQQHRVWRRLAEAIGRRPRAIWTVTALALAALAFGLFGLRFGQPADKMYTKEVGSVVGQQLVAAHYPSGASYPTQIIAAAGSARQVVAAAAAVDGVATANQAASQAARSADGRWARVEAVLADPPDSAAAKATIDRLRDAVHAVPGADALVGGETATTMDIERAAGRDNAVLMPLILLVVFVVLVLLLRALVAPLLLAASVVLSFAAAMGAAGLVFHAIGYPGMYPALPLWAYLFLVTLGVDYTIFLMTRAREEVARVGHRAGILSALTMTGGVITSAGVVLAATFATLVVLPVVMALQIGLIVALGVMLDAIVVRSLLIPALAVDLGPRLWWPGRPARHVAEPPVTRDTAQLAA